MRRVKVISLCLPAFAATLLVLTGCKLTITVPEGGRVVSKSAAYACESGQVCTIDINDLFFDEVFIVEPEPGYDFTEWRQVERGLCAKRSTPCKIVSGWAQYHEIFMQLLESDDVFYLEPVIIANLPGTRFSGLTSQQLPMALRIHDDTITHLEFTYQQLGEVPPDPDCQHEISMELSGPIDADGIFDVEVSVPPQASDSGKLQLVAFDGRLSGSLEDFEATGDWDFDELEIVCEKSNGKILRNFCGERFLPCIDAIDFQFEVERAH